MRISTTQSWIARGAGDGDRERRSCALERCRECDELRLWGLRLLLAFRSLLGFAGASFAVGVPFVNGS